MKKLLNKMTGFNGVGIYIGPDVVLGVSIDKRFGQTSVNNVISKEILGNSQNRSVRQEHLDGLNDLLNELCIDERYASNLVRVIFDDYFLTYFVLDVEEKVDSIGLERILKWHLQKKLGTDKNHTYQAKQLKAGEKYKIIGVAIKDKIVNDIAKLFDEKAVVWDYAEPLLNYTWQQLGGDVKKTPGAYVWFGYSGWTLMVWGELGEVDLVKSGLWQKFPSNREIVESAFDEIIRFLSIYRETNESCVFEQVFLAPGKWINDVKDVAEKQLGFVLVKNNNQDFVIPQKYANKELYSELQSICSAAVKI